MNAQEHSILMTSEMVKALLVGLKSQTRRVIKPQPQVAFYTGNYPTFTCKGFKFYSPGYDPRSLIQFCPYGQTGSKLWVKETWATEKMFDKMSWSEIVTTKVATIPIWYKVGDTQIDRPGQTRGRWRSGLFMPRYASRITLETTEIRVQRVQDISEDDAVAEGTIQVYNEYQKGTGNYPIMDKGVYSWLWDKINGKRGYGWSVNPFVWALTVRVV